MRQLITALKVMAALSVLTGLIYPLLVTGAAQLLFPHLANGSLLESSGRVVGSRLIGQRFDKQEYFHGRPSAAGNNGYDGLASGGSNLGPTSRALADRVRADVARLRQENPAWKGPIPADLATASGSGLDPEISPDAAELQVPRVAAARGLVEREVRRIVARQTASRQWWLLGEPRVNVLELNLALDGAAGRR
jgi:potassium-transporting ATPase KdpC subunit